MNDNFSENDITGLAPLGDEQDFKDATESVPAPVPVARRSLPQMMRKIPVTLTLEVGSAAVSLQDLVDISPESVIELDTLAGEPLVLKVNGTPIGRAEVVVSGENYGLRVVEMSGLDLDSLNQ